MVTVDMAGSVANQHRGGKLPRQQKRPSRSRQRRCQLHVGHAPGPAAVVYCVWFQRCGDGSTSVEARAGTSLDREYSQTARTPARAWRASLPRLDGGWDD
jgi:hypothetical protein